ncbi:MAG TPA: hypothetical protein VGX21_13300 [Methylomirabilota bacterium]|jgi:hypothetical protein|nr:hypothetical protein [Methylomirabilota bacterium]
MSNGPAPPLTDAQVAAVFAQAGFAGQGLLTMVATVLGESGGDPDILGDENLANAKWGPSIGLGQIRSLWAERGTGGSRDPDRLTDPDFNAAAAYEISSRGTNFKPWSVFTSGRYRQYLARAWAAVAGAPQAPPPKPLEGLEGAADGGGVVGKIVDPLISGLSRIALYTVLIAGGVALIAAGGWRASGLSSAVDKVPGPAGKVAGAVT